MCPYHRPQQDAGPSNPSGTARVALGELSGTKGKPAELPQIGSRALLAARGATLTPSTTPIARHTSIDPKCRHEPPPPPLHSSSAASLIRLWRSLLPSRLPSSGRVVSALQHAPIPSHKSLFHNSQLTVCPDGWCFL